MAAATPTAAHPNKPVYNVENILVGDVVNDPQKSKRLFVVLRAVSVIDQLEDEEVEDRDCISRRLR